MRASRAAKGSVQGDGEKARHGEVVRSFRVAGRFAARSDCKLISAISSEKWIETYEQSRLMTKAGADDEARHPLGEQGGRQARRHKASAETFPA
jgi:hypothetical protein